VTMDFSFMGSGTDCGGGPEFRGKAGGVPAITG